MSTKERIIIKRKFCQPNSINFILKLEKCFDNFKILLTKGSFCFSIWTIFVPFSPSIICLDMLTGIPTGAGVGAGDGDGATGMLDETGDVLGNGFAGWTGSSRK